MKRALATIACAGAIASGAVVAAPAPAVAAPHPVVDVCAPDSPIPAHFLSCLWYWLGSGSAA